MNALSEELREPCSWCRRCTECESLNQRAADEIDRLETFRRGALRFARDRSLITYGGKAMKHRPERSKIPPSLQSLAWVERSDDDVYLDGSVLLAAVPVYKDSSQPDAGWYYAFDVVHIACDVDYFAVECNDEPWGWNMSDVDWYVVIRT